MGAFDYICEGQISLFDFLNEKKEIFRTDKPIRIIEMFAGYGSQSLALKELGVPFEHHFVCEFDKYAIQLYNAVHHTNFPTKDIRDVKGNDLNIVDCDKFTYLLTYSFPCQDISAAGLGKSLEKGSGTRSGLLWEVERILNELGNDLPQVLVMENVKNLLSEKHKPHFDAWCKYLESKGYSNFYQVVDASDYGVPQHRERVFMISVLGNYEYKFPDQIELTRVMKDILEDNADESLYVNTEKATTLIDNLIESGELWNTSTEFKEIDKDLLM